MVKVGAALRRASACSTVARSRRAAPARCFGAARGREPQTRTTPRRARRTLQAHGLRQRGSMHSSIRLLLIPLLAAGCVDTAPAPAGAIVDHGDGTYSRRAPDGLDTSSTRQRGAMTWSYVGQSKHAWHRQPFSVMSYVVAEPKPDPATAQLYDMMHEDRDGALWRVTGVDRHMLGELVARRDAAAPESRRGTADPSFVQAREPVGARRTVVPNSWLRGDCDGSGGVFATDSDNHYYMNDDDRVVVDSTSNPRRRAIVDIRVDNQSVCIGVILRSDWVLTSAHCIFDGNNDLIDRVDMSVVRRDGVAGTHQLQGRNWDGGFTSPGTDPNDDWALLHLAVPLAAPYSDMDISSLGDSAMADLPQIANLAYPGFAPNCSSNLNGSVFDDLFSNSVGALGSIFSEKVNLKIDGGPGHSGSPVFYCPNGNELCEGDEKGFVLAVWSGWDGVATTAVGTKGPAFRDAAVGVMDSP